MPAEQFANHRTVGLLIAERNVMYEGSELSEYIPRVVDGELDRALRGQTAVLIEGAKGVGKTMTASTGPRAGYFSMWTRQLGLLLPSTPHSCWLAKGHD